MSASVTEDVLVQRREAFRGRLIEHDWLLPSRAAILPGLGAKALAVFDGLSALLSRMAREAFPDEIEPVRFPPVFAAGMLEQTGYVASFPQLLGTINSFLGGQPEFRELMAEFEARGDWQKSLSPTGLALASAGCHPLYAYLEGTTVGPERLYELTGDCFRHEPSDDPMRLVSFRMREYVRLGTEAETKAHRQQWLEIAQDVYGRLELPVEVVPANDPFFGRGGAVLAANQIADEAKFEVVAEVYEGRPTAIASANYHGTHFGDDFALRLGDGSVAHSACAGFGMERTIFALAARHGFEPAEWPTGLRKELGLTS